MKMPEDHRSDLINWKAGPEGSDCKGGRHSINRGKSNKHMDRGAHLPHDTQRESGTRARGSMKYEKFKLSLKLVPTYPPALIDTASSNLEKKGDKCWRGIVVAMVLKKRRT